MRDTENVVMSTARRLVDRCDRMRTALRSIAIWSESKTALYDPINDRYSLQLPGELVRRLRELTDVEPNDSI
jgi:hypothetical protein